MKCKSPFQKGVQEFGCGQCLPCRINRQRLWTIRLLLEAAQHEHSLFVTLTYDDKHYPRDGCISVREAQLFLKRLRRVAGSFRYFLVGEYGERTERAHYHALLFGLRDGRCVDQAWGKGFVHVSGVGPESIGYVAGYCLKGATTEKGIKWIGLTGKRPEFARMSLRPGIGAAVAAEISARLVSSPEGARLQSAVPAAVRQGQKMWPLGRYLRGKVAEMIGTDSALISRSLQLTKLAEVLSMDQAQINEVLEKAAGVRQNVAHQVEARIKRKTLERRL